MYCNNSIELELYNDYSFKFCLLTNNHTMQLFLKPTKTTANSVVCILTFYCTVARTAPLYANARYLQTKIDELQKP